MKGAVTGWARLGGQGAGQVGGRAAPPGTSAGEQRATAAGALWWGDMSTWGLGRLWLQGECGWRRPRGLGAPCQPCPSPGEGSGHLPASSAVRGAGRELPQGPALALFQKGEVECSFTPCPELACPREDRWLGPGQCCFTCREPTPTTGEASQGYWGGQAGVAQEGGGASPKYW